MSERTDRVLATGLSTAELAERLGTSDRALSQWVEQKLPLEQSDIIEVAMSMFEQQAQRALAGWPARF